MKHMAETFPTRDIRNLGLQAGSPVAFQSLSGSQAQSIASAVPNVDQSQLFGLALMNLLKRYQQLGTRPFAEQQFAASQAQVGRLQAQTSPSLIGAAPGVQAGVRAASVEALQPTITGAKQSAQTFGEQLQSFGDILGQARQIMAQQQQAAQKAQDDMRDTIQFYLRTGGSGALQTILTQQPELFKVAGMDAKTIGALIPVLKAKEDEERLRRDLLTPAEAQRLGVPYGTTRVQAATSGIERPPTPIKPTPKLTKKSLPQPKLKPTRIIPGEYENLINRYIKSGYPRELSIRRVNELFAERPGFTGAVKGFEKKAAPPKPTLTNSQEIKELMQGYSK